MRRTFLPLLFSSVLLASTAIAQELPFTLEADDISYDLQQNTVTAVGDIDVIGNSHRLRAQEIIFNQATNTLTAQGGVTFFLPDGTVLFVEELALNGEFRTGVIEALRLRLGPNNARLTATQAEQQQDGRLVFTNARYTPCQGCAQDQELPWYVRADQIAYTPSTSTLNYENPRLISYGRTIAGLPRFSHTIGPLQAKNGLLPPRFGSSGNHGLAIETAYYIQRAPNEDMTLRTRVMTERGVQLKGQHRLEGVHWRSELNGSLLNDNQTNDLRSHLDINTVYVRQPGQRFGLTGTVVADETYLDDFFSRTPAYLDRTLYAEDASENHYVALHASHYQDLRNGADNDTTAQVLPRAQVERVIELGEHGSQLRLYADAQALHRDDGANTRRIVTRSEFSRPLELPHGQRMTLSANVRADAYHLEETSKEGWTTRVLPQVAVDWERPMISPTGRHMITPRAQLVIAPRGGTPDEIPNDDSVAYELDVTNLFASNRFAGFDRVETGPRFTYGIDQRWGTAEQERARLFVGQSYQWFNDADLPELGGTATEFSDYVALLELRPRQHVTLTQQVRLDNADLVTRRADTNLTMGDTERDYMQVSYSYLDEGPSELGLRGGFNFNPALRYEGELRRDLTDGGKQLLFSNELQYTHNCYRVSLEVRRRGFNNRTVPPATDILFNLDLLTLGSDE